jgi:4-amino-4-deoxy-L-arabinose transferase-like glycosyltransferase
MGLAARIGWIVLICVTLYLCYLSHLGAIGFVGPDEPRYAWIARAMVETGDWVTPRLYDKPWFEKPPLYYWGAAICFKLFGVSEAAARLPSAVSALLATLAMAWLAWSVYGAETARWLLLLLPTTVGMIGFSHAAATDMPFSGMLTIAMVCAAAVVGLTGQERKEGLAQPRERGTSLEKSRPGRLAPTLLFGFFLGLAVLAKGPAGIILCGGAVFLWALFTKRWRDALRLLHPTAIAAFCVTALPWYVLCARRNPDFFRIFIIEHNFKRYLTPEFQHIQPFWFYVPVLFIALLPWTAAFAWTICTAVRSACRREVTDATGFLLAWAGFCVLFFSTSQSKLPGYVLPSLPALGVFVSRGCAAASPVTRRPLGVSMLGVAAIFLALWTWLPHANLPSVDRLGAFFLVARFLLIVIAVSEFLLGLSLLMTRKRHRMAFASLSVVCLMLPLIFAEEIVPRTPLSQTSPRDLAQRIKSEGFSISNLKLAGVGRNTRFGLEFYLHTELIDWDRNPNREVYVLAGGRLRCEEIKQISCKDLWDWQDRIDVFPTTVLHLVPLAGAAGGKAQ